jgi:hypothetical protein
MPILDYEQYSKIRHNTPYILSLKSGENFLYYFGERHLFKPVDPQWDELKSFWTEFLDKTRGQKRIVFTEGGIRPIEESEEQAIIKHGGMGLATFLAHQEKIDTHSPEPDEKYERSELEKNFSRDIIQYYYFARVVLQWGRKSDPKPDFVEYITRYLDNDKKESGWGDYDFSLDNMKLVHKELFNQEFDEHDTQFFYDVSNPVVIKSEVNKVSASSSIIRDEYIVKEIQTYLDKGYSIFAEYGCSHVVMQEPLLRELFESDSL